MKKNIVSVALLGMTFALASCGSSKQTAASDYEYQLWKQQQEQQSAQQRPARKLRTAEPCIELALAESENMRAYGTATSYVEKTALNEAERDARNRLAAMIKAAVPESEEDGGNAQRVGHDAICGRRNKEYAHHQELHL